MIVLDKNLLHVLICLIATTSYLVRYQVFEEIRILIIYCFPSQNWFSQSHFPTSDRLSVCPSVRQMEVPLKIEFVGIVVVWTFHLSYQSCIRRGCLSLICIKLHFDRSPTNTCYLQTTQLTQSLCLLFLFRLVTHLTTLLRSRWSFQTKGFLFWLEQ